MTCARHGAHVSKISELQLMLLGLHLSVLGVATILTFSAGLGLLVVVLGFVLAVAAAFE